MSISVFDIFKIGVGPSSSHTVGPMKAALTFATRLRNSGLLPHVERIKVSLFGSLGATGKGHGSDKAIMVGLLGDAPDSIDPDTIGSKLETIRTSGVLQLLGAQPVRFQQVEDILYYRRSLPFHPNGLTFEAQDSEANLLLTDTFYSVGGGFVVTQDEAGKPTLTEQQVQVQYPFNSGAELLALCTKHDMSISQIAHYNEVAWRRPGETSVGLLNIWSVMQSCVARGCKTEGVLPGPLRVPRRAASMQRSLSSNVEATIRNPLSAIEWVNLYALAVNEENAAGGRVVTAPTNGAAGIIPAVLYYYTRFEGGTDEGVVRFLLAAGAVGMLYKANASISGAEVGCQGEVGVACSMAAAGLAEALGGTPAQVENAAEIGMEHNLGLTCDPVGGLVQIPCIERNAMGAVKAINAARIALRGDGSHVVSLDAVIKTMRETGADMKTKYKETSRGGLAVNIVEC